MTVVKSTSPFAGAEIITFDTFPPRCCDACSFEVKIPVDSTTIRHPSSDQLISAGFLSEKTFSITKTEKKIT